MTYLGYVETVSLIVLEILEAKIIENIFTVTDILKLDF